MSIDDFVGESGSPGFRTRGSDPRGESRRRWTAPVLVVLLGFSLPLQGCLNRSYNVSQDTLRQQAALAPEARGTLRATQRLGIQSDPVVATGPSFFFVVGPRGRLRRDRRPPRGGGFVVAPGTGEGVPRRDRRPVEVRGAEDAPRPEFPRDSLPDEVTEEGRDAPGGDALTSDRTRRRGSRRNESGDDGDDGAAAVAALYVIAGVAIGVGLAATEGMRFEGDLRVSPQHPLHLRGPGGQSAWVPLADLTPELAAWADDAVLLEDDGFVQRLARAPLNRRGFVFALDFGASGANTQQSAIDPVFAARTSFGVFPVHALGFLLGAGLGTPDTLEWRVFGEVQAYPFALGAVELGFYGQFGKLYGETSDGDTGMPVSADTLFGAGGALLQIDLTTRLALTLRGGVMYAPDPGDAIRPEALLGDCRVLILLQGDLVGKGDDRRWARGTIVVKSSRKKTTEIETDASTHSV